MQAYLLSTTLYLTLSFCRLTCYLLLSIWLYMPLFLSDHSFMIVCLYICLSLCLIFFSHPLLCIYLPLFHTPPPPSPIEESPGAPGIWKVPCCVWTPDTNFINSIYAITWGQPPGIKNSTNAPTGLQRISRRKNSKNKQQTLKHEINVTVHREKHNFIYTLVKVKKKKIEMN